MKKRRNVHLVEAKSKRMQLRLSESDAHLINEWSDKLNLNKTDFILAAIRHYVSFQQSDYSLPSAETKRLNQLIDVSHLQTQSIQQMDQSIQQLMRQLYLLHTGSIPDYLDASNDELLKRLKQTQAVALIDTNEADDVIKKEIQRLNRVKFQKKGRE